MSSSKPRRKKLSDTRPDAKGIYERPDGKLEVGYRDDRGKLRWQTIEGGISAARRFRDEMKSRKHRGEATGPVKVLMSDASAKWLAGPVEDLREGTQKTYGDNVRLHIDPELGSLRLDQIDADRMAEFFRHLKDKGLSDNTCVGVRNAVNGIYRYARRALGYRGDNPVGILLPSEKPQPKNKKKRRLFTPDEFWATIEAARRIDTKRYTGPWATLFMTAGFTAGRVSELLALIWSEMDIDSEEPSVAFSHQLDRSGSVRVLVKTDDSSGVVPIPLELAAELRAHRERSEFTAPDDYVFATRKGTPITQRNTNRALRDSMRAAVGKDGAKLFPILSEYQRDENGGIVYEAPKSAKRLRPDGTPVAKGKPKRVKVPEGAVPSMHSFRHGVASRALAQGESVDELALILRHRDATVTRQVYMQDVQDARRMAARRDRIGGIYGNFLETED